MDDLLKSAIADAKAVRETALANARIALEEAFQPRIQSMLAKKIQAEVDDFEDGDEFEADEEEDFDNEESFDDEDEVAVDAEEGEEEIEDIEVSDDFEDDEEEFDDEEAPELEDDEMEESEDFDADDEFGDSDPEEDEDELDLEAVIRELESEIDDEYEDEEEMDTDYEDEEEDLEENDVSSDIGKSDNKQPGKANQTSGIGTAGKAKLKEEDEFEDEEEEEYEDDMDEDIDLQELLNQLTEDDDEDDAEEQLESLQAELTEHREVVKYLRDKLNEVNLLNAKLLYTNKLFRSFELDNGKKFKVVETFDRAKNIREVKLVYSTLAESFGSRVTKKSKPKLEENKRQGKRRSSSSKPIRSTKPKTNNILSEGQEVRERFQKLANIK